MSTSLADPKKVTGDPVRVGMGHRPQLGGGTGEVEASQDAAGFPG